MWSLVRAEAGSRILNWIMMLSILLAQKITWHIYISILLAVTLNPPQPGPEADLLCYLFISQENVREKKKLDSTGSLSLSLPLSICGNTMQQNPNGRGLSPGSLRISPSLRLSQFLAIPSNRILRGKEGLSL
jgi:hypothetical protein